MSDHGTYAMYQKHRKNGEPPCGPCIIASRKYMRGYRRKTVNQPIVAAIRAEVLLEAREAVAALPVLSHEVAYAVAALAKIDALKGDN